MRAPGLHGGPGRRRRARAGGSTRICSSHRSSVRVRPSSYSWSPNERKVGMTAIELTGPDSVELLAAHSPSAWHGAVDGNRASWSGGPLPAGEFGWFPLRLRATGEPGQAAFSVTQHFADGRTVTWPAKLGVNPGAVAQGGVLQPCNCRSGRSRRRRPQRRRRPSAAAQTRSRPKLGALQEKAAGAATVAA